MCQVILTAAQIEYLARLVAKTEEWIEIWKQMFKPISSFPVGFS